MLQKSSQSISKSKSSLKRVRPEGVPSKPATRRGENTWLEFLQHAGTTLFLTQEASPCAPPAAEQRLCRAECDQPCPSCSQWNSACFLDTAARMGLPRFVPWDLPCCLCVHDLINEHSGLKRHQLWVGASTGAHLIPLPAHEQHTENIQHLQLVHDLVHDLHGLGQLCPCWGVGQSTLIWRLWKRRQRCETEAASTGKDLLQLLLFTVNTADAGAAHLLEFS